MNFVTLKRSPSCSGVFIAMVAPMATAATHTDDLMKGRATMSSGLKRTWCRLVEIIDVQRFAEFSRYVMLLCPSSIELFVRDPFAY